MTTPEGQVALKHRVHGEAMATRQTTAFTFVELLVVVSVIGSW
jgi:type II secretory pathway pseudopilin PulG